jgi:hypothetical protein
MCDVKCAMDMCRRYAKEETSQKTAQNEKGKEKARGKGQSQTDPHAFSSERPKEEKRKGKAEEGEKQNKTKQKQRAGAKQCLSKRRTSHNQHVKWNLEIPSPCVSCLLSLPLSIPLDLSSSSRTSL